MKQELDSLLLRSMLRLKKLLPEDWGQELKTAYWKWRWQQEGQQLENNGASAVTGNGSLANPLIGSERAVLTEHLADYYPFHSVLEIGCGYGQNLKTFATQYPGVQFVGLDHDPEAIADAEMLVASRYPNVKLIQADALELSKFTNLQFDIVISSAFLLFISPDHIHKVLKEMLRISRRAVLLLEQHQGTTAEQDASSFHLRADPTSGYWIHDYKRLLSAHISPNQLSITPIPAPRWEIELWQTCACVIDVKKVL